MKMVIALAVLSASLFGVQLGVDGGRFVLGQISEARADQFLLDTQTGQVWRLVKDGEQSALLEPVRIGNKMFNPKTNEMDYFIGFVPLHPFEFANTKKDELKKK